jgi:hypothetical protein
MHSHFGFGGIFWLFLVFWFVFGFRRACWWGGPVYYRPWRYRRYRRMYGDEEDEEREWREWHRREHERTAPRPAGPPNDDARGQG